MSDEEFDRRAEEALIDLNKAITLKPAHAFLRYRRAEIYHFTQRNEEKFKDIEIGEQLDPALAWFAFKGELDSETGDMHFPEEDDEADEHEEDESDE